MAATKRDSVSAEVDEHGEEYLSSVDWTRMDGGTLASNRQSPVEQLFTKLYGNLPVSERLRVLWLSGTLFFIIGGYWLLRSLKDPIVSTLMGVEYIPKCKMLSLVVVFILVFVYNRLLDIFPKHHLFYIIGGVYTTLFGIISLMLADPVIGLSNTVARPDRYIAIISYCAIESFGSICVSLFWAFTNSTMTLEHTKSSYGLIVAGAQIGSILGPCIATAYATTIGIAKLYSIGAVSMALMVIMMYTYTQKFGVPESVSQVASKTNSSDNKGKSGVMEGLQLFMKYDYIRGIFALSCFFMVSGTIMDFLMKSLAKVEFDTEFKDNPTAASENFAKFMGTFGIVTNSISFLFSLLGTSMVIRKLGLRLTLLAFPCLCLSIVLCVIAVPKLYVMFGAMIALKGFSYSLNNPCKEMLYQPTSTAVKFKSKSWIDIFGARGSKAVGSLITNAFADNLHNLIKYGGFTAVFVSALSIYIARLMGIRFDEYIETGYIVGESDETAGDFTQLDDNDSEIDDIGESDDVQSVHSDTIEEGIQSDKKHESQLKNSNNADSNNDTDTNGIQMQEMPHKSSNTSSGQIVQSDPKDSSAEPSVPVPSVPLIQPPPS